MVSSLFTRPLERNFAPNEIYISKRGGCQLQKLESWQKLLPALSIAQISRDVG
jgi:hypothetical protein